VLKLRKRVTGSNLGDTGQGAVRDFPIWRVNFVAGLRRRQGGHGEGLRRSHGDAAGAELDAKLINRLIVNTGTSLSRSYRLNPFGTVG